MRSPLVIAFRRFRAGVVSAVLAGACVMVACAQRVNPPRVLRDISFGGKGLDYVNSIDRLRCAFALPDGHWLLTGDSASPPSGTRSARKFGGADLWCITIDSAGTRISDVAFGGTDDDLLADAIQLDDGGILLLGESRSGRDERKDAILRGESDLWLVKLDSAREKVWDASFGGRGVERAAAITVLPGNSGFALAGTADSTDPQSRARQFGQLDYWLIFAGADGRQTSELSFGGSSDDVARVLLATADGGFLIAGSSRSGLSGNKTSPNFGASDYWVLRLGSDQRVIWEKAFGGSAEDELTAAVQLPDGGFVLGGFSSSLPGGNKSSRNLGNSDYWLIRTDASGNKLWEQTYGGADLDELHAVTIMPDGGFLLGGASSSPPGAGKLSAAHGLFDFWLVRTDSQGRKLWDNSIGGGDRDVPAALIRGAGGRLVVAGSSESATSGNKKSNQIGGIDFWLVELESERFVSDRLRLTPTAPAAGAHGTLPFSFSASLENGRAYRVEASSNLVDWFLFDALPGAGTVLELTDSAATNSAVRFYRLVELP